jgi:hypothetical protein
MQIIPNKQTFEICIRILTQSMTFYGKEFKCLTDMRFAFGRSKSKIKIVIAGRLNMPQKSDGRRDYFLEISTYEG